VLAAALVRWELRAANPFIDVRLLASNPALYRVSPAEKLGTASGLLRTFGYVGSIASATITGIAFRTRVDDAGLHHVSLTLIAIGAAVLLMTVFDRHLKPSDGTPPPRKENDRMSESTTTPTVIPSQTALLLMDYQNAVLRDAADQDYRLFVLADATADPDAEVHRVLIDKVFPHQADIVQTGDLEALSS